MDKKLSQQLISNTKIRKEFIQNPKQLLHKYDNRDFDDVDIIVKENTLTTFYFVIPDYDKKLDLSTINAAKAALGTLACIGSVGSFACVGGCVSSVGSIGTTSTALPSRF